MRSGRTNTVVLVLGLGLGACQGDVGSDGGSECQLERLVDVDFDYNTGGALESESCELLVFGPSPVEGGKTIVQTSCGYSIALEGLTPPMMELEAGDSIQVKTQASDPEYGAQGGWLAIEDTEGRVQLVAMSLAHNVAPFSLGDLGEVELEESLVDGCPVLLLRAQDEEVTVNQATSTQIELAGTKLLVQMGPITPPSNYSLVMFRLPG